MSSIKKIVGSIPSAQPSDAEAIIMAVNSLDSNHEKSLLRTLRENLYWYLQEQAMQLMIDVQKATDANSPVFAYNINLYKHIKDAIECVFDEAYDLA